MSKIGQQPPVDPSVAQQVQQKSQTSESQQTQAPTQQVQQRDGEPLQRSQISTGPDRSQIGPQVQLPRDGWKNPSALLRSVQDASARMGEQVNWRGAWVGQVPGRDDGQQRDPVMKPVYGVTIPGDDLPLPIFKPVYGVTVPPGDTLPPPVFKPVYGVIVPGPTPDPVIRPVYGVIVPDPSQVGPTPDPIIRPVYGVTIPDGTDLAEAADDFEKQDQGPVIG